MKKIFIVSLMLMFGFATICEARVVYDSSGRNIVENDTIRGRKQGYSSQNTKQYKTRAAAAAKLNYNGEKRPKGKRNKS